jgi:hypothetical protein
LQPHPPQWLLLLKQLSQVILHLSSQLPKQLMLHQLNQKQKERQFTLCLPHFPVQLTIVSQLESSSLPYPLFITLPPILTLTVTTLAILWLEEAPTFTQFN